MKTFQRYLISYIYDTVFSGTPAPLLHALTPSDYREHHQISKQTVPQTGGILITYQLKVGNKYRRNLNGYTYVLAGKFFTGVYSNLTRRFIQDDERIPEVLIICRRKTISKWPETVIRQCFRARLTQSTSTSTGTVANLILLLVLDTVSTSGLYWWCSPKSDNVDTGGSGSGVP